MQTTILRPAARDDELTPLRESWELHLDADGKSPKTITSYRAAVDQLAAYLKSEGMPTNLAGITREHIEMFIIYLRDLNSASTAATRYRGLRHFFRWLVDEGEIVADQNPMRNMNPPKVPEVLVPIIPDDALDVLFASCKGSSFIDRRDKQSSPYCSTRGRASRR